MNDQWQETQKVLRSLPAQHKHQIMMVLGQMIAHCLTPPDTTKEPATRKGREPSEMVRHDVMFPPLLISGTRHG
jgi:hypothetical protein